MAEDQADRLKDRPEETWEEILRRLRTRETPARGMFARVQAGPENSGEIADDPAVRLVVLHPQYPHTRGDIGSPGYVFAMSALTGRGTAQRMNRNMIVFLAADARRYTELDEAVRKYLAWKDIGDRIPELDLSTQQVAQAHKRLKDADETIDLRISTAYHWLLVPVQPAVDRPVSLDEIKTDTAKDRLAETRQRQATRRRPAAHRAGAAEHPAGPGPVPVFRLGRRAHRGGQALGVLLPVRLPAPAGRAFGARPRYRRGLRSGDLGPGR